MSSNGQKPNGQSSREPVSHEENPSRSPTEKPEVLAEEVGLKVILWTTQALFENRNTLPEKTFEKAMCSAKKILASTLKYAWVRNGLGANREIWMAYSYTFTFAVPSLEAQSFVTNESTVANPNSSSATLMALNHNTLMKDLERLNDLVLIARNILATTSQAQDLAGDSSLDQHILKLVDVCVRVTARGYDGDPGSRSETQWANVVSSCKSDFGLGVHKKLGKVLAILMHPADKKLLVTCLQFLYNLVQQNEKRKLLLWLDLFANSSATADADLSGDGKATLKDQLYTQKKLGFLPINTAIDTKQGDLQSLSLRPEEMSRLTSEVRAKIGGLVNMAIEQSSQEEAEIEGDSASKDLSRETSELVPQPSVSNPWSLSPVAEPRISFNSRIPPRLDELPAVRDPQSAATTLQRAKDQLMARLLEPTLGQEDGDDNDAFAGSENDDDGDVHGSDVAANGSVGDENNDDDDEYRGPGDQERGLLTDIPLVLSPSEIEPLPMLIQLGIVAGEGLDHLYDGTKYNKKAVQDMQSVRCNILLAQESGRNLLRELLIFITAWDLQDEDFYFKIMMSIMEAILENGLMPFAYQSFAEVKDIVSPAQSMVIKILTQIFRGKQGLSPGSRGPAEPTAPPKPTSRVDTLIVRYIFTTFRTGIIPETCALIYLQGQIRAGAALPEDFPLNLWDMERVYEGVYQFLEFFAVLTESEEWKNLLVQWEIVSELITLLRELDGSIPKAPLDAAEPPFGTVRGGTGNRVASPADTTEIPVTQSPSIGEKTQPQATPIPVSVERPYDQAPPDPAWPQTEYADGAASETPSAAIDNQEPSDFEWRNLKKLVVLVLSSLVWKSPTVQNQIRQYGGVEMVLACCNFDSNNPYIREHAIMCLRFLLEGNTENQAIVRQLEPRKGIPDEMLDKRGYETYIDDKGKAGLRPKEDGSAASIAPSLPPQTTHPLTTVVSN